MTYRYEIRHTSGKFHAGYGSMTMLLLDFKKLDKSKFYLVKN